MHLNHCPLDVTDHIWTYHVTHHIWAYHMTFPHSFSSQSDDQGYFVKVYQKVLTVYGWLENGKDAKVCPTSLSSLLQQHQIESSPRVVLLLYVARDGTILVGRDDIARELAARASRISGTDRTEKQPIRTGYLGHVTGYQPMRD